MPSSGGAALGNAGQLGWLVECLRRTEDLLLTTASASSNPLVVEASIPLIKAGGKRVRPALVHLGARAGEAGRTTTDLSAAAIELIHLASLYHDDVIDETEVRRGVPTPQAKWGTAIAVLAGDYLFAAGCSLGAEAGGEVPGILARAVTEVCEGQIAEIESLHDPARETAEYLRTIRLKTATLFRAASELGASTSGADPERRAALVMYGENFGIAFQLVDDLLDVVGSPHITGKVPGTDLREGVFTLPVLIAAERAPALKERLAHGVRDVEEILPLLESTGAIEATLREAKSYASGAVDSLVALPESDWRRALEEMVEGVLAQVT
jgi:heptaprenyl diphosphate synthase